MLALTPQMSVTRCRTTHHESNMKGELMSFGQKIFYKTVFLYKSSWKVESAQLENFYFPVGKLFFLSWKIKFSQ
jgi:hypothetical protein